MKNKWFSFQQMQALGQSLMVPVSVLPGAGLVVALGRFLQLCSTEQGSSTLTTGSSKVATIITSPVMNSLGKIFYSSGLAIFEQLPVIFAIGVAIGFSGGAGVAGLSAAAAYFTLSNLLKTMSEIRALPLALNTGVFGGILMGLLAAYLYKKYHETRLHPVLGFFSGKRLVPILSVFFAVIIGLLLSFVWPPIQSAINEFGVFVTGSQWGPAFYAAGKRLLIPVGLHHVYYPSFLFEFGQFVSATGEILKGDSPRYFAGDPTAGLFMASEFPIMLFGLPAAALAMTLRAPTARRKAVAGIMISAALTSIVTGITEPIEFSFIFVAPLLFVIHVVLAFISGLLTHWADLHLGYTFSASLIDFVVGYYNQKNALQLWLVIGPLISILYFSSFYFLIPLFNFKTPGREDADDIATEEGSPSISPHRANFNPSLSTSSSTHPSNSRYQKILVALGGASNILNLDACITRLRLQVKDVNQIQESALKKLGAAGLMKTSKGSVQIIFGTESDFIKEELKKLITGAALSGSASSSLPNSPSRNSSSTAMPSSSRATTNTSSSNIAPTPAPSVSTSFFASLEILSPLQGKLIPLSQIPDATFSQGFMGPGVGMEPTSNLVVAPFSGVVASLFHTKHAIGLESTPLPDGKKIELLIHIGIDTVKMQGRGFEALVQQGDTVKKGQPLLRFDLELIKKEASSSITPVIITNIDQLGTFEPTPATPDTLLTTNHSIGTIKP